MNSSTDSAGAHSPPRVRRTGDLETTVKWVLRGGLLLAVVLLVVGLVLAGLAGIDNVALTRPGSASGTGTEGAWGIALLYAGVVVLVLTPVVRVGSSVIVFARRRDLKFAVITAFVFLLFLVTAATGVYR